MPTVSPSGDSEQNIPPHPKLTIVRTILVTLFIIFFGNFFMQFAVMGFHIFVKMVQLGSFSIDKFIIQNYIRDFFKDSRFISETIVVSDVVSIMILLWFVRSKITKNLADFFGFNKIKLLWFILWNMVMVGIFLITDFISNYAEISEPEYTKFMRDILATDSLLNLILLALALGAATPVFEELMFRGFMYKGLIHSKAGIWGAVLIPAIIWSLVHFQYEWIWIVVIFFMGIIFGIARHLSGSIYPVIGMHALNNLLAFIAILQ